jgi:Zn-dependent peptidase ImmA (M78 family)
MKLVELSSIPHEVAALNRGQIPAHRVYEDTEWQANAFAAAFLVPAAGLANLERSRGILTAQELVRRFNVSFDAARIRLDCFRARRSDLLR